MNLFCLKTSVYPVMEGKVNLEIKKDFAQGGCGVSFYEDAEDLSGHLSVCPIVGYLL